MNRLIVLYLDLMCPDTRQQVKVIRRNKGFRSKEMKERFN